MRRKMFSGAVSVFAAVSLMTATVFAAPSVSSTQEIISSSDTIKSDSVITVGGKEMTINEAISTGEAKMEFNKVSKDTLSEAGVSEEVIDVISSLNEKLEQATTTENSEEADKILLDILNQAVSIPSTTGSTQEIKKENLSMLTSLQELSFVDKAGNVIKDAKNVTVTWKAPITTGMTVDNIHVLHYSIAKGQWELITPEAVDAATGNITAFFSDLSPVSIVFIDQEKVAKNDKAEEDNNNKNNNVNNSTNNNTKNDTTNNANNSIADNNKQQATDVVKNDTTGNKAEQATEVVKKDTTSITEVANEKAEAKATTNNNSVQTGDTRNIAGYVAVAVCAAGVIVFAISRKKKSL